MYKVIVEYTNGDVEELTMDRATWFRYVQPTLEKSVMVENYRVETL